jgi:hypothetical protein
MLNLQPEEQLESQGRWTNGNRHMARQGMHEYSGQYAHVKTGLKWLAEMKLVLRVDAAAELEVDLGFISAFPAFGQPLFQGG